MNDYERVARIICYLDARHTDQPDLAELAGQLGLSSFHFHRLFSDWAGVTPKDFLQCLTLAHVKRLLRQGETVLETALTAGLSGPGRLHDLCLSLEAATPGEIKSGGQGWRIEFGVTASPFGPCLLAQSPRGVCHLGFVDGPETAAQKELQQAWPGAKLRRNDRLAAALGEQIFLRTSAQGNRAAIRALVKGSVFQVRVWQALLRVPAGALVTYGQLAAAIGQPAAARAVGSAVGANALALLIPCHRVIRQTGLIGEYRWGTWRKRAIIAWETAAREASPNAPQASGAQACAEARPVV